MKKYLFNIANSLISSRQVTTFYLDILDKVLPALPAPCSKIHSCSSKRAAAVESVTPAVMTGT